MISNWLKNILMKDNSIDLKDVSGIVAIEIAFWNYVGFYRVKSIQKKLACIFKGILKQKINGR